MRNGLRAVVVPKGLERGKDAMAYNFFRVLVSASGKRSDQFAFHCSRRASVGCGSIASHVSAADTLRPSSLVPTVKSCCTDKVCYSSKPSVHLPRSVPASVGVALQGKVQNGKLHADPAQERAGAKLQRLQVVLQDYDNHEIVSRHFNPGDENDEINDVGGGVSTVAHAATLDVNNDDKESGIQLGQDPHEQLPRVPRGMYIHGEVGTGKSLLMDLFFETAPVKKKQRFHFHEFLSVVHRRIHRLKQHDLATRGRDFHVDTRQLRNPVYRVAVELANEVSLLCLDEFQGKAGVRFSRCLADRHSSIPPISLSLS
jgi:AFG1-like ATPase